MVADSSNRRGCVRCSRVKILSLSLNLSVASTLHGHCAATRRPVCVLRRGRQRARAFLRWLMMMLLLLLLLSSFSHDFFKSNWFVLLCLKQTHTGSATSVYPPARARVFVKRKKERDEPIVFLQAAALSLSSAGTATSFSILASLQMMLLMALEKEDTKEEAVPSDPRICEHTKRQ